MTCSCCCPAGTGGRGPLSLQGEGDEAGELLDRGNVALHFFPLTAGVFCFLAFFPWIQLPFSLFSFCQSCFFCLGQDALPVFLLMCLFWSVSCNFCHLYASKVQLCSLDDMFVRSVGLCHAVINITKYLHDEHSFVSVCLHLGFGQANINYTFLLQLH